MPVLLALLLAAGVPLDEDESFRAGLSAFKELRLQEAALSFQRVALDDSRAPHERARVQMWLGATYGQLGDLQRARAAFAFAFALSPDAMLPVRVSPKVTAVLEEERATARRLREEAIGNRAREEALSAARAPTPDGANATAPAPQPPTQGEPPTRSAATTGATTPPPQQSGDGSEVLWYVGAALAAVGATLTGATAVASGGLAAVSYATAADPQVMQDDADDAYLTYQTMLGATVVVGVVALTFGAASAGLATLGVMAE
jgi:tetratricopeptide (TPR) repeat protein